MTRAKHIVRTLPLLFVLAACNRGTANLEGSCNSGTETAEVKAGRYAAFARTHAELLTHGCANCHDGISGKAPYSHSAATPEGAYAAARPLADFGNPAGSRFVRKMHLMHQCGTETQCEQFALTLTSEIASWAGAEGQLPPPPECSGNLTTGLKILLPGRAIKPSDLSKNSDTDFRWDLGAANPVVGKALLSVKFRQFTNPTSGSNGSYKVSSPTLATQDFRLDVVSIIPTLNGVAAPIYANYSNLHFVVERYIFDATASVLGFPPLSENSMIMNWGNATTGDTIGWVVIVKSSTDPASTSTQLPGCKAPNKFKLVYDNVFNQKRLIGGSYQALCNRCHGDPTMPANIAMNLSNQGRDACLEALMRTNFDNILQSLIFTKPSKTDPTGDHPELLDLQNSPDFAAERQLLYNWIDAERKGGE